MTGMDDMPPDPCDPIPPHTLGHFEIGPDPASFGVRMKVLVRCLDCPGEPIGVAGCTHEAVRLMVEHAETMNS
ncbi:hypothetical protein ACXJJ3_08930 [Kribbella sp. WER1]